ncbi:MAG: PP2C family protein-serine/threonine phosphatase [Crocinitomicaceae bacterium]
MNDYKIKHFEDQLYLKELKLNSLLEITNAINLNYDVNELVNIYEFIVKEQLGLDKFILFNKQENWNCLLKHGVKGKVKNINIEQELTRFKDITVIASSQSNIIDEFDTIIPVYHKETPLAYLLVTENSNQNNSNQNEHLNFIQTLTNILTVAIENKRMAKISIKQERLKKELEVAKEMQQLLFPSDLPSDNRMDISAKYTPRHEVGGDYYDFIPLGNEEYIICMADVSGKGISAALLMANFQATIRTIFKYENFEFEFLLNELNQKVMKNAKGEKFITFFIAHYNANNRKLTYVNAGHNHPFITSKRNVEMLDKGSIGLGMMDELPFLEIGETTLSPNTTLILYTDGVVELENTNEEAFGIDQLVNIAQNYSPLNMEDLNNLVFSKLDEWRGPLKLIDDTAILSCRFF